MHASFPLLSLCRICICCYVQYNNIVENEDHTIANPFPSLPLCNLKKRELKGVHAMWCESSRIYHKPRSVINYLRSMQKKVSDRNYYIEADW